MQEYLSIFNKILPPEDIRQNEPMADHTTFEAGGSAAYYLTPGDTDAFTEVISGCRENGIPFIVVGNGSNLLVADGGYEGAIISALRLSDVRLLGASRISAGCGAVLAKVANFALDNDLSGLEFASGIPGTVGGAVYMNAGAYEREMKDVLENALVLNSDGSTAVLGRDGMMFAYRNSLFQREDIILLEAVFSLDKGDYVTIKDRMLDLNKQRAEKQPLDKPSAGSAFKRPLGHFAGALIMEAGLAGFRVGGAQVSEKHCGFIVNAGNATATDIINLMEYVQDKVFAKFSIALEPEFRIIGNR